MAKTNQSRIGEGLDLLNDGLRPFIKWKFQPGQGDDVKLISRSEMPAHWDPTADKRAGNNCTMR